MFDFAVNSWVNSLAAVVVLGGVSVATAQPLPAFTTRFEISTAVNDPTSLRTVDFDGDGDMDIVTEGEDVIRLLLSDGAPIPSFEEVAVWTFMNGSARSVAVGDIDGDGDLDIVSTVGSQFNTGLYWHENDGQTPPSFVTFQISDRDGSWLELGDMNGDNIIDIVLAKGVSNGFPNDIVCFLQDPHAPGTFQETIASANTGTSRSLDLFDLDGDDDLDIVFGATFDNAVRWLENTDGSGTSFTQRDVFSGPSLSLTYLAVSVVDVDLDGKPDILSSWREGDIVRLHRNLGGSPPVFETTVVGAADGPQIAFGADMDGDGFTDVVSISSEDDSVRFWRSLNTTPPTFAEEVVTSAANMGRTLALADMDGDADLDIVSGSVFDEAIRWYRNDANVSPRIVFGSEVVFDTGPGANGVVVADFANTGAPSIASIQVTNIGQGLLYAHHNLGGDPPNWSTNTVLPSPGFPTFIESADLDGDSLTDIVVVSLFGNGPTWYRNDGNDPPTFIATVIPSGFAGAPSGLHVVDLDQDGDQDTLIGVSDAGLLLLRNLGGAPVQFQSEVLDPTIPPTSGISSADIDGDGDLDILFASGAFGFDMLRWYENVSVDPVVFTPHDFAPSIGGYIAVCGCDMDDDGDMDIAAGNHSGDLFWFENMDGAGLQFVEHEINPASGANSFGPIIKILSADFDRDGDCDLVTAQLGGDPIRWHENVGAPAQQFITHIVSTMIDGQGVAIGDINGDGQLDLATAFDPDFRGTVNWHENLFHLPADLNDDGLVNGADLAQILIGWGEDQGFGADLNNDGVVNGADLAILLVGWRP